MIMKCLVVIFAMTTVVCASGWFTNKIVALTIMKYVLKRCVDKLPTQKELEACMEEVIKDMLRIK